MFVPITMREVMLPGLEGPRQPPQLLGLSVRAAEAGGVDRAGRAALDVPYRAIVNDVEAPLQKGMSEQTMARFRAKR